MDPMHKRTRSKSTFQHKINYLKHTCDDDLTKAMLLDRITKLDSLLLYGPVDIGSDCG